MAPDQWGDVGKVVFVDFHAAQPDLLNGFLHVDRVPVHDGVESEAQGTELLLFSLSQRASDFAALAMVNAPPEAVTQFCMVELGQDTPPERRVVDVYPAHARIRKSVGSMILKLSVTSSQ